MRRAVGIVAGLALSVLLALAGGRVWLRRPEPPPPVQIPSGPLEALPERLDATRPAHVVLISIDTLRADHLSLYGYPRPTSPALDAFARRALVFESAWSQSPKTAESHMTLFTGLYPQAHRVRNLRHRGERLPAGIPTLAGILRRAGYRTAGFHGGGNLDAELGFDLGFERYEKPGDVRAVFQQGTRWLEGAARDPGRPFFLFLHTKVLHDPYEPPPEYAALFSDPHYAGRVGLSPQERRRAHAEGGWWKVHRAYWERVDVRDPADVQHLKDLYDGLIRYMDDHLGPFLTRLDELGLGEDTLVVFTSDHGEEFLEHNGFRHASVYREVLHVPLVLRLPGGRSGGRVARTVSLVDVLPTLLDRLGLPRPAHLQGRSFAALLAGGPAEASPVYSEWAAKKIRALRVGDWKYVDRRIRQELYDLSSDPAERRDLAERHPEIAARLRRDVERLSAATTGFAAALDEGRPIELAPETRDQLEALGYLGGGN